jgi:hypothetical protein
VSEPVSPVVAISVAPAQPLAVNSGEAAKMLGICERVLWQLTKQDEIKCVWIGDAKRYRIADLQTYLSKIVGKPAPFKRSTPPLRGAATQAAK